MKLENVIKEIAKERELPEAVVKYILRLLESARQGTKSRPTYMAAQLAQLEKCLEEDADEN